MSNMMTEQHFSQAPLSVDAKSSVFDRSTNWKGTFKAGKLIPIFVDDALPGDVYNGKITELIRQTSLIAPVMDDCRVDTSVFFVPNRMLWEHWKEFCGENDVSAWTQETQYYMPTLDCATGGTIDGVTYARSEGDAPHCMGVPLPWYYDNDPDSATYGQNVPYTNGISAGNFKVDAAPFRAYRKIWNEFWRDENTQDPKLISYGDTETDYSYYDLLPVNRFHDYFSSCLPDSQKGNAVSVALTGFANVYPTGDSSTNLSNASWLNAIGNNVISDGGILWKNATGTNIAANASIGTASVQHNGNSGSSNSTGYTAARPIPSNLIIGYSPNLQDPSDADDLNHLGIDIESLRVAIATQRLLQTLAVGGSRYIEIIKSLFGITSPDARQQRPELIAWDSQYINTTEVTQTSETGSTPLGTQGAYSKTLNSGCSFNYSATEHGYLMAFICVRHSRSYAQGINRMWFKREFADFYNPLFSALGEQPVYKKELYVGAGRDSALNPQIFGYQEAWSWLKYKPSITCGLLDPTVQGTLGTVWTYTDRYVNGTAPTLSDAWMQEGDTEIESTQAVQNQPQFMADIHIALKHQRPIPIYCIPQLEAHL